MHDRAWMLPFFTAMPQVVAPRVFLLLKVCEGPCLSREHSQDFGQETQQKHTKTDWTVILVPWGFVWVCTISGIRDEKTCRDLGFSVLMITMLEIILRIMLHLSTSNSILERHKCTACLLLML